MYSARTPLFHIHPREQSNSLACKVSRHRQSQQINELKETTVLVTILGTDYTVWVLFKKYTLRGRKISSEVVLQKKPNKITAAPMCNFSSCYMELQNQYLELIIAILFIVFLCTT